MRLSRHRPSAGAIYNHFSSKDDYPAAARMDLAPFDRIRAERSGTTCSGAREGAGHPKVRRHLLVTPG